MLSAGLCLPKEAKAHEGCSVLLFFIGVMGQDPVGAVPPQNKDDDPYFKSWYFTTTVYGPYLIISACTAHGV